MSSGNVNDNGSSNNNNNNLHPNFPSMSHLIDVNRPLSAPPTLNMKVGDSSNLLDGAMISGNEKTFVGSNAILNDEEIRRKRRVKRNCILNISNRL